MSRRREVERHLLALNEIADIMGGMKMLASMETRKLGRRLQCQAEVVRTLERAAADLLGHYPQPPDDGAMPRRVFVLFGSERGFCGEFNRLIYEQFMRGAQVCADPLAVAVGDKLRPAIADDGRVAAAVPGASVVEDINVVLGAVVDALDALRRRIGSFNLTALYHDEARSQVRQREILPPFQTLQRQDDDRFPPVLNLPPRHVYGQLVEQYLFAVRYHLAYVSLAAENQRRVEHLDAAIHRVDQRADALAMKRNALRQEEITEEIEVILLSAGVHDAPGRWR